MGISPVGKSRSYGCRFRLGETVDVNIRIIQYVFKEIHRHFNYDNKHDDEILKEMIVGKNDTIKLSSTDGELIFSWGKEPGHYYTMLVTCVLYTTLIDPLEVLSTSFPFIRGAQDGDKIPAPSDPK